MKQKTRVRQFLFIVVPHNYARGMLPSPPPVVGTSHDPRIGIGDVVRAIHSYPQGDVLTRRRCRFRVRSAGSHSDLRADVVSSPLLQTSPHKMLAPIRAKQAFLPHCQRQASAHVRDTTRRRADPVTLRKVQRSQPSVLFNVHAKCTFARAITVKASAESDALTPDKSSSGPISKSREFVLACSF